MLINKGWQRDIKIRAVRKKNSERVINSVFPRKNSLAVKIIQEGKKLLKDLRFYHVILWETAVMHCMRLNLLGSSEYFRRFRTPWCVWREFVIANLMNVSEYQSDVRHSSYADPNLQSRMSQETITRPRKAWLKFWNGHSIRLNAFFQTHDDSLRNFRKYFGLPNRIYYKHAVYDCS